MEQKTRLGLLLKMVNNIYEREFNSAISKIDLTAAQCNILGFLHENEGHEVNPIDLEKRFHLKRPTVTGLLKRLEEKGFIRLGISRKDNRYKEIQLTEKAYAQRLEMISQLYKMEDRLYKNISEEEKLEVVRILNTMLKNMSTLDV